MFLEAGEYDEKNSTQPFPVMPSPFPGMDPYLEHPEVWPGVHLLLIASLAEALTPQLRPKYLVSVEVRLYETSGERGQKRDWDLSSEL